MSEPSATRRELETMLRSFLPKDVQDPSSLNSSKPTLAKVGVGGLLGGYVWGRLRGRSVRKAKKKEKMAKKGQKD
ncbi:MAG: hypothetical protein WA359_12070 [Acidimicrobiales bacterium]